MDRPTTADGVGFVIGMPLVLRSGRVIPTDPAAHEVFTETFAAEPGGDGRSVVRQLIRRRGADVGYDLGLFYSSEAARRAALVRELEAEKAATQSRIDALTASPSS